MKKLQKNLGCHTGTHGASYTRRGGKDGGKTELTTSGRALLDEYYEKVAALERFLVNYLLHDQYLERNIPSRIFTSISLLIGFVFSLIT